MSALSPIVCDGCGQSFRPVLKERPIKGGGMQQRFRCPHCRRYYVVANITPEGLKIRQRLQAVSAELEQAPGDEELARRLDELRQEFRAEVSGP